MRRRWKYSLTMLLVLVATPVAVYYYARWWGERELQAVVAELDANDPGWRWEDILAARPKLRDEDDARAIVVKARALVGGRFLGNYRIQEKALDRPRNATIPPEDFEPFDDMMKASSLALAEARKFRDAPAARFHCVWSADVPSNTFDDVQKAREFINLLQCAACWQAHRGSLDEATDDCLAMQRISQSLADEPTLIVHLVRVALQAVSLGALERVLAQGQVSPDKLRQLQAAWESFDSKRAMVQCLRGERAYSDLYFVDVAAGKLTLPTVTGAPKGTAVAIGERLHEIHMRANLKSTQAWNLRYFTNILAALELPEPARTARLNDLDMAQVSAPGLARMLIPAFQKTLDANRRGETMIRCAVVALAAERYRHEHKHWPKALADVSPKYLAKLPDDPYSGQPLQLRVADDGIVIYSVGPDGKQTGTAHDDRIAGRPSVPYEFRLWNVAERRKIIVAQPMLP